jgi:hypothetical protein
MGDTLYARVRMYLNGAAICDDSLLDSQLTTFTKQLRLSLKRAEKPDKWQSTFNSDATFMEELIKVLPLPEQVCGFEVFACVFFGSASIRFGYSLTVEVFAPLALHTGIYGDC